MAAFLLDDRLESLDELCRKEPRSLGQLEKPEREKAVDRFGIARDKKSKFPIPRRQVWRFLGHLDAVGAHHVRKDLLVAILFPRIQHDGRSYLGIVERIGVGSKAEARPAFRLDGDVPDGQRLQAPQLVRTERRPGDHRRAIRVERFLEHRADCPLVGRGTRLEGVRPDACPMARRPIGCLDVRRRGGMTAAFTRNKMQHQLFEESRIAAGEAITSFWPRHCHESACSRFEIQPDNTR